MNDKALILTAAQAAAVLAANPPAKLPDGKPNPAANRRLEPRALEDGTFLLNADVLDDPHFTNPAKAWRTTLITPPLASRTLTELSNLDLTARAAKAQLETQTK